MASTTTEVSIASRGMILINKKPFFDNGGSGLVSGLTSTKNDAKAVEDIKLIYYEIRDEVLEAAPWDFALATSTLTEDTGAVPDSTWTKAFDVPADMVHPWYIGDSRFTPLQGEWAMWNGHLVTNESSVTLTYVKRQTDPTTYTEHFITAFARRIGMELSLPLTNSDELYNRLEKNYNKSIRLAHKQNTRRKFERRDIYPRTPMQSRGHRTTFDTDDRV
jgi:hypothetical protein